MMMSSIRVGVVGGVVTRFRNVKSAGRLFLTRRSHQVEVALIHNLYQVTITVLIVQDKVTSS